MKPRIVFMGSPEFALPTLEALAGDFHVAGVVTQPDRPAGRGRALAPPPVKTLAQKLDLPVIQPRSLKEPSALAALRDWAPEVIVVAAFGQILRTEVLDLPPYGCLNVHASLLPRWRGAAPIQAAILHGDELTGITIMKMDPGIDTGPILSQQAIPILAEDTGGSLSRRLADLGAGLMARTLPGYMQGEITPTHQDDQGATYAPMLEKAAGALDFQDSAASLARRVRAFNPWPGAFIEWRGAPLKVHRARPVEGAAPVPGERTVLEGWPAFGTASGVLVLQEVQPAGKRRMTGEEFLHGARDWSTPTKEQPA